MPVPRFLVRHGWLIAIALAYLYVFPYFPKIRSANELPRVYLTRAMAAEHRFAIDTGVKRYGATADVSPSGGHSYSNKAPGSSMLALPAYAAVRAVSGEPSLTVAMWICRVTAGIVPMIAFLWLLGGYLERFAPDPRVRRLVIVAYAFGSLAMTYSVLFYSHQLAAACIGSAWILASDVADKRRGWRAMFAAGAFAGAAPLVDYQAVFAALPIAVFVIVRVWRWPRRELVRAVGAATAGAAVPIAILLAYHAVCFGSPWATGYNASTTFAHFHQQGFLGITELRWEAFWGSLLRPDNGLFFLAPWLLLAIPGAVVLARRDRGTAAVGIAVVVIYVLFISSINFWRGGWGVGPRYVTAMLPFMLPMVAACLQALVDRKLALAIAASTIVVGVAIYALSTATFPYWPDVLSDGSAVRHPLFEVMFPLLGDGLVAPNVAMVIGVGGLASLVPYLVLVGGSVGVPLWRATGWRGVAIASGLAVAVLLAYAQLPRSAKSTRDRAYGFVRSAVQERQL
ncbi:MAG TPA: hypothetical protein VM513_04515 [Kofleriaceae bacterium]|nr:hypothetical protein [Kofleriaceae bacterium]